MKTIPEQVVANTDREVWREREGDYYADSIHVTQGGGIGINCGGHVIVKPIREWHKLAVARAGWKYVYAKRWRTLIHVPESIADEVCDALCAHTGQPPLRRGKKS